MSDVNTATEKLKHALAIMDDSGRRMPQTGKVGTIALWEPYWDELRRDIYDALAIMEKTNESL